MIKFFTQHLCIALLGAVIFSSCSRRPVAYFQRSAVEPSAQAQVVSVAEPAQALAAEPGKTEAFAKATTTITQLDVYVQNNSKLASNKKLTERMNRVKTLLASTPEAVEAKTVNAPHKTTVLERLMLKKINKRLNRQLARNHAETITNPVILIGGIVLLIGGLILLIAGTGTAAFIGLILALIGALGTVLGLFGQ